jgi:SNF2 family DNA or RNA helicase
MYSAATETLKQTAVCFRGVSCLSALLSLRQICLHPRILAQAEVSEDQSTWQKAKVQLKLQAAPSTSGLAHFHSTKFGILKALLLNLKGNKEKLEDRVVIMTYFTSVN